MKTGEIHSEVAAMVVNDGLEKQKRPDLIA
jgi:hypothetical protein